MPNKSSRRSRLAALFVVFAVVLGVVAFAVDRFLPAGDETRPQVEYDLSRNLVQRAAPDGRVARYLYDGDRLVGVEYGRLGRFSGIAYAAEKVRFAYDGAGLRTEAEDAGGVTRYGYDELARPSAVTMPDGRTVSYAYDPWGRVHELTYPDGSRSRYEHDYHGRLLTVGDSGQEIRYQHEEQAAVRQLPNGVTTIYRRTPAGALASITHQRRDGSLIAELRYQYDPAGRVTAVDERTESGNARTRFGYDALGRVVRVVNAEGVTTFTYDALGNRLSESGPGGTRRFEYDAAGRLVRAGGASFVYDAAGNLIERRNGDRSAEYDYDAEGRLVEVRGGGRTIRYQYDAEGHRVAREVDGQVTRFTHHRFAPASQVIAEEGDGGARRYLVGSSRLMQLDASGKRLYFLEDHLGSTRWLVDEQGRVAARYAYTPFGRPTRVAGEAETRFLFTGEEWDEEAGLLYLRARHYDPDLGRFLSVDPADGRPQDPQSYNLYAYASNDPVNRVDPLGLQSFPPPPTFYDPMRSWMSGTWWRMYNPWTPPPPPPPPSEASHLVHNAWNSARTGQLLDRTTPWQEDLETFINVFDWAQVSSFGADVLKINDMVRAYHQRDWVGVTQHAGTLLIRGVPVVTAAEIVASIPDEDLIRGANLIATWPQRSSDPLQFMGHLEPSAFLFNTARNLIYDDVRAASQNILRGERRHDLLDYTARFDPLLSGALDRSRNLFFPPPPGGGGDLPLVGGVYLDQAAKVIGELGTITGAVYDPASGRVILVGDKRTSLPPMRADYLASALRAVYTDSPHEPGMTIDPHPQNPHAPIMLVRFFGNTENTRLGWVMFEADRLMKGYSIGRDNLSREPVSSKIAGYRSVTAMGLADAGGDTGLWSRFWLVPEPVTARVSDDGRGIQFDPIRMRVRTETMRWAGGQLVPAGDVRDRHAEAFAEHFTKHYDAYAAEQPVFAELRQVTAAVAVAKWMKERGVAIDRNVNRLMEGPPHATPETTRAAFDEQEKTWIEGSVIRTLRMSSFGGVEMTPQVSAQRSAETAAFAKAVSDAWKKARAAGAGAFDLNVSGRDYRAVALPDANQKEVASYAVAVADLPRAAARLAGLPGLTRSYDSLHNEATEFGRSWSLLIPRLDFLDAGGEGSSYISVAGAADTQVREQRFVLANTFGRGQVRFEESFIDQDLRRVGFRATGSPAYRGIYPEGELYRLIFANVDQQALFDADGRLVAILTPDSKTLYEYDSAGRHAAIRHSSEGEVRFTYDAQGRIASAASDGEQATYAYDAAGNLVGARGTAGDVSYRYEGRGLLQSVSLDGRPALTNRYDDAGRLLEQRRGPSSTLTQRTQILADGSRVVDLEEAGRKGRRHYDAAMRLTKEETPGGVIRSYSYGNGRLTAVDVTARNGAKARVAYDADGRVASLRDTRGVQVAFRYHPNGLPAQTLINGRPYASYGYDAAGRPSEIAFAGGWGESYQWDASGRLLGVRRTTPTRTYVVPRAPSPPPALPLPAVDRRTRTVHARDAAGAETVLQYAPSGLLSTVRDPAGGTTTFHYTPGRRVQRIELPNGSCREYRYDGAGRVVGRGGCGNQSGGSV